MYYTPRNFRAIAMTVTRHFDRAQENCGLEHTIGHYIGVYAIGPTGLKPIVFSVIDTGAYSYYLFLPPVTPNFQALPPYSIHRTTVHTRQKVSQVVDKR